MSNYMFLVGNYENLVLTTKSDPDSTEYVHFVNVNTCSCRVLCYVNTQTTPSD